MFTRLTLELMFSYVFCRLLFPKKELLCTVLNYTNYDYKFDTKKMLDLSSKTK